MEQQAALAPVRPRARIEVLDMLRGIALLGILFINIPYMAAPVAEFSADVRAIGWTLPDRIAWSVNFLLWSGTMRCVLQFLFGAGMLILTAKAMEPDGPVGVADLYYRRNLWLLAFGVADAVLLFWPGDILHIYAIAALFIFPFRRLAPKLLLTLGLGWSVLFAVGVPDYGLHEYVTRTALVRHVEHAVNDERAGQPLTRTDRLALVDWKRTVEALDRPAETKEAIAEERAAHEGSPFAYARYFWRAWSNLISNWLVWSVIEAVCTMLIGMAMWKWGIIQGARSCGFYLRLLIGCYAVGFTLRGIGLAETLSFTRGPQTIWFTAETARLALGLGHIALINLAVQTRLGRALLQPFKAAGRVAFSLYFLQQFLGMWVLFAPWGFDLWGRFGWAEMSGIALAVIAGEIVLANLWLRAFASGPLEWAWRSLAYGRRLPFRKPAKPLPETVVLQAKLASNPPLVP